MNKLTSIARKLDTVFKIVDVMLKIAFVACLVCVAIVAAAVVFDLPDEMVGSVDPLLKFGPLTFHVADSFVPAFDSMLLQNALMCALAAAICCVAILGVRTIRAILAPMKDGRPFDSAVSQNLRKLGWLSLLLGAAAQFLEAFSLFVMFTMQKVETLLISDRITHVDINLELDLGFLMVPAVFFLLAYVFKYGEELQNLSDETL